jgi:hypothetical protein
MGCGHEVPATSPRAAPHLLSHGGLQYQLRPPEAQAGAFMSDVHIYIYIYNIHIHIYMYIFTYVIHPIGYIAIHDDGGCGHASP